MTRRSNVIRLPRAKIVSGRVKGRKLKDKGVSFLQRRQRELAWILYISEGFIANLDHALAVNCVTFDGADHDVVASLRFQATEATRRLRQHLATLGE